MIDFKLKSFPADIARRRAVASMYHEGLGDVDQLTLPPAPLDDPRHFDVYQNYELEADDRDALRDHLLSCGVHTIIQWGGTPVHQFAELGFHQSLPITDAFFRRCLMLPMNVALEDDDVQYVIQCTREFYGAG